MSWASHIKHLYRRLRHPDRSEADLHEEVQSYFDVMVERRMSRGMTREEAERAARLEFDGSDRVKEKVREARAGTEIETTWRDFRFALRSLRKNSGFAAAAVLSLGLGLGANTAFAFAGCRASGRHWSVSVSHGFLRRGIIEVIHSWKGQP